MGLKSPVLFPVYKLDRENTQPENMCDIGFEKAQCCAGKVNRTSVMQKQPFEAFFKKCFMRNFAEFTNKKTI